MTPDLLFKIANLTTLGGWAVLAAGIAFNNALLRDVVAGKVVPLILAAVYTILIVIFWAGAEGGFGSLGDVAKLFANPWLLLAGWLHYLAFDLLVGASIARRTADEGLPRLILVPILPLTFLFGPIGFLLFEAARFFAPKLRRGATV